ncbi:hypothetical protein Droror1_Dr00006030 [Drosera rotundifolia]
MTVSSLMGLHDRHPLLIKDTLSSTLACILVLRRWQVGEDQMTKANGLDSGLDFIRSNFASTMDEKQHSPVGFDVIFPTMIDHAINLDVNFHLPKEDVKAILKKKDFELERCKNTRVRNHCLAFISEGMGELQDWEMAMTYQRKNGSILNSPSATAAALLHIHDSSCHSYLCSVLQRFGSAVPRCILPTCMLAFVWLTNYRDCYTFLDMVFPQNGCRVKKYRGMGSLEAMTKGSDQRYLGDKEKLKIAKGVVGVVTDKGVVLKFLPYTTQAAKQGFQDLGANYLRSAHELLRSNVLRLEV